MNSRRAFLRRVGLGGSWLAAWAPAQAARATETRTVEIPDTRAGWLAMLARVAEPVLENVAAGQLRARLPVEAAPGHNADRAKVTHLEAVGRTLAGIAPWLEWAEGAPRGPEADRAQRWSRFCRDGLAQITDRASPDYISFTAGAQCLVDAAFLAHGLLRAPQALWAKLDPPVQGRVLESMKSTRSIHPGQNNWLLFSAMIEAFLARAGSDWQPEPIAAALEAHERWYKGDGLYGDGPEFHWDYYNSFVIQPFLLDVLDHIGRATDRWSHLGPEVLRRARRYAAIQERLIAPDGTFPVVGRSICYRCGAFQLLAQMALRQPLPDGLPPAQVRSALTAVIRRTLGAEGTFDEHGWLTIGLAGHQPALGETYISTGSLYLCSLAFLPLGLPPDHAFWTGPTTDWTSRRVWSGENLRADHALPGKENGLARPSRPPGKP